MSTLAGKTILIVGGTSGIGFATAQAALASQAAHIIIASSSQAKVEAAVARLRAAGPYVGVVSGKLVDGRDEASIKRLVESVEVDHLVWTSGDALKNNFPEVDLAGARGRLLSYSTNFKPTLSNAFAGQFDVRFWGPVTAAKYAKIKAGGSITLTSGSEGAKPMKGCALVAGMVGSVEALVRGLAVDLAPIRVNAVSPGYVLTELWDNFPEDMRARVLKHTAETLLVKHVALPHEIAEAYIFLLKCNFITGQTIAVDGGKMLV